MDSLSCFGHNLHLAVTAALKKDPRCNRGSGVARKITSSFSMSWKRRRDLSQAQVDLNLPQHSLIADCVTRWGSSHKMVSRILEQEAAVRSVLGADRRTSHLIPTWQDVEFLESIDKALTPIADMTNILGGENYVTVSAIKPLLNLISTKSLAVDDLDTPLTKDLKSEIKGDIQRRYSNSKTVELLDVASFLDPRFKDRYITAIDLELVKDRLKDEGVALVDTSSPPQSHTVEPEAEPPVPKKRNLGALLKSGRESCPLTQSLLPVERVQGEIDNYLRLPHLDEEANPLEWWKLNSEQFEILAKLARKYLVICATSCASERLFSTSGKIVTPLRSNLKPENVDKLVFLAMNL